ncbi:MAG TPA: hypothetical protein VMI75_04885 [Polyangiaceae bacterium]|nr:hypothetical protein [Polyangiaceae bacterium]
MTSRNEQLAQIECELERQNQAWDRAKQALLALGDVQIAIPIDTLETIGASTNPHHPAPAGSVRA